MITLGWNTGDDTPTTVTTTELTGSIAFQIEQWYEISSQNEVPRYRTESTFTVSDAVIKMPDEIFVTLILASGVRDRSASYGILKRLSDAGMVMKLDASEQGTFTSYDSVVIKRMSNIVRVNDEYFCKLVFSEIKTATSAFVETDTVVDDKVVTFDEIGLEHTVTHHIAPPTIDQTSFPTVNGQLISGRGAPALTVGGILDIADSIWAWFI